MVAAFCVIVGVVLCLFVIGGAQQMYNAMQLVQEYGIRFNPVNAVIGGMPFYIPWGLVVLLRPTYAKQFNRAALMSTWHRLGAVTLEQVRHFVEKEKIPPEILSVN